MRSVIFREYQYLHLVSIREGIISDVHGNIEKNDGLYEFSTCTNLLPFFFV